MQLSDFSYNLPDSFIAAKPPKVRGTSNLLVLDRKSGKIEHKKYSDFVNYPQPGDVVVLNQTKVINARVFGFTEFGGKVEVMFLEDVEGSADLQWKVLIGNTRILRSKKEFFLGSEKDFVKAKVLEQLEDGEFLISLEIPGLQVLEKYGHVPLPKYIKREDTAEDKIRYQTIFAKEAGAVAAPTASLNMTAEMLAALEAKDVEIAFVNLKVSWDTFKPVRSENILEHKMHSEFIEVSKESAEKINKAKSIWAVGTTVVRTLESTADENGMIQPYAGRTKIFIYPGYKFKVVDHMLTNFHAPKTTVIMMASAFAGKEKLFEAYEEAKSKNYKFLSYGDSMLIL